MSDTLNPWLDQVSTKHTVTKFVVLGWVATLIVATHQWAFVINPSLYTATNLRQAMYLYWVGWIVLCIAPQVFAITTIWEKLPTYPYLIAVGAARPVTIMYIHLLLHAKTGKWYFNYLTDNPIFIVSDILVPAAFIYLGIRERNNARLLAMSTNREASDSVAELP